MANSVISVGSALLTRVNYIDVTISPEVMGLVPAQWSGIEWAEPLWVDGDQVRVGASVWFADIGGTRVAFDPVQAADSVLRSDAVTEAAQQQAVADVLEAAGFARESVDRLVMTHIEGIGMVAWRSADGTWSPFFPNARISVHRHNLEAFLTSTADVVGPDAHEAWHSLIDAGLVDPFGDGDEIAAGITVEATNGHCPGHTAVHFRDDTHTVAATMVGHLAISPLHLVTGECPQQHPGDPSGAWAALQRCSSDGRWVIGPLWPSPGYGRLDDQRFVPGP